MLYSLRRGLQRIATGVLTEGGTRAQVEHAGTKNPPIPTRGNGRLLRSALRRPVLYPTELRARMLDSTT